MNEIETVSLHDENCWQDLAVSILVLVSKSKERALEGLFLAFQSPPAVSGVQSLVNDGVLFHMEW